jgi:hypothetical protein
MGLHSLTYLRSVIRCSKDQFWSSIVTRADVGHVWLIFNQDFGASKVAKLQNPSARVEKEVLRFDIAMAYSLRMNVCE